MDFIFIYCLLKYIQHNIFSAILFQYKLHRVVVVLLCAQLWRPFGTVKSICTCRGCTCRGSTKLTTIGVLSQLGPNLLIDQLCLQQSVYLLDTGVGCRQKFFEKIKKGKHWRNHRGALSFLSFYSFSSWMSQHWWKAEWLH